jgi:hypothetical protein
MYYILVLDKNDASHVPYYVVTEQSLNAQDLLDLQVHRDRILAYLPKTRWRATSFGDVTVRNIPTGQKDSGRVYRVEPL